MKRVLCFGTSLAFAVIAFLGCGRGTTAADSDMKTDEDVQFLSPDEIFEQYSLQATAVAASKGIESDDAIDHAYDDLVMVDQEDKSSDPVFESPAAEDAAPAAGGSVDLRRFSKIINQTSEGSCSAYSVAGAMQVLANKRNQRDDISAQHLWNMQRKRPSIDAAIATARSAYVAPVSAWPNGGYSRPTVSNPDSYGFIRLGRSTQMPRSLAAVRSALDNGTPVIMGSSLNNSWRYMNSRGVINPLAAATGSWMHASHAYGVVGYVTDARFSGGGYFIIKNSWGSTWGDRGYAYMPFNYCQDHLNGRGYCYFWSAESVDVKGGTNTSGGDDGSDGSDNGGSNNSAFMANAEIGSYQGSQRAFRLSISGDLASVVKVQYHVHPTFGANEYMTSTDQASGFKSNWLSTYANHWSTVGTTVYLNDGRTVEIGGAKIDY